MIWKQALLTPGATADLILVDYKPYTDMNSDNLPWHIVFGFQGKHGYKYHCQWENFNERQSLDQY